jgi:hypothetical protein
MNKYILILLCLLLNFSCTNNNNQKYSQFSNIGKNCLGDSSETKVDTIRNFDTNNLNEVVCFNKDENGVWFDEPLSNELRLFYQWDKKLLIAYLNRQIIKKHYNIIVLEYNYKIYHCIDGNYDLNNGDISYSISIINNKNDIILSAYKNMYNDQVSNVEYFQSSSKKFTAKGKSSSIFGGIDYEKYYK